MGSVKSDLSLSNQENPAVTATGIRAAALRLEGVAVKTPLLENALLNQRAGGRVFLKAETLQHYGAFKFRGAYNLLAQLSDEEKRRGVLAWSSGNHAQGVSFAAKLLDIPATIVMPADAPGIKIDNVRALGAEIVPYDRYKDDREAIGRAISVERGLAFAPPFDHVDTIEGQGTVGLEAFEQAQAMGVDLDAFLVCCGGGGLTAGCATILEEISPKTETWIVEPEGFDETWASIRSGEKVYSDASRKTICDALATPAAGLVTLPIMERLVRGGITVTEDEVRAAMAFAFRALKLVVEPGGAAALAAVLTGKYDAKGKNIGLTLSGGNVDPALFSGILSRF